MLHGRQSPKPLDFDELVPIDLTPQVDGYCANLARAFAPGETDGLAELRVYGSGHEIGRRFEEPPASSIIPPAVGTGMVTLSGRVAVINVGATVDDRGASVMFKSGCVDPALAIAARSPSAAPTTGCT